MSEANSKSQEGYEGRDEVVGDEIDMPNLATSSQNEESPKHQQQ